MTTILDIETSGLNAMENVISCICIKNKEVITSFCGEDEKKILRNFWNAIPDSEELVGFNISGFDIPFIIRRSLINGIKIKKIGKITDLRLFVNGFFYSYNKYEKGTLDDWCSVLNCPPKVENGLKMVEYYNSKEFDKIQEHCVYDIEVTEKLYNKCLECNIIQR